MLFVPGLVLFLDETQVRAEATSLLAMVLVAAVGAYRQGGYGNLRLRDGIIVGLLSPVGVVVGTVVANEVPERALQIALRGRPAVLRLPARPPRADAAGGSAH